MMAMAVLARPMTIVPAVSMDQVPPIRPSNRSRRLSLISDERGVAGNVSVDTGEQPRRPAAIGFVARTESAGQHRFLQLLGIISQGSPRRQ